MSAILRLNSESKLFLGSQAKPKHMSDVPILLYYEYFVQVRLVNGSATETITVEMFFTTSDRGSSRVNVGMIHAALRLQGELSSHARL